MKYGWKLLFILMLTLLMVACLDDGSDDVDTDGDLDGDSDLTDGDDSADGDTLDGDTEDGDTTDGDTTDGEPFSFMVISDTHVRLVGNPDDGAYDPQLNQDNLNGAVSRINNEFSDAAFVAVTGDMVGALFSEDTADYGPDAPANPADTFKTIMDNLSMPYHAVLGNHDYQKTFDPEIEEGISTDDIEAIESVWEKVLDIAPYYSMTYEGIRFIFLNANRGPARTEVCTGSTVEAFCTGSFDDEQLAWFEAELAEGDPVVIFMHHPPITDTSSALFAFVRSFLVEEDDAFYDIVESHKENIMAIFVGHGHILERDTLYSTIDVYETGAIGDTGGNPDNIHRVEVDPSGPSINVISEREDEGYWSGK